MRWWQHSAGLWRLSILSRFCVERMYTNTSPPLERRHRQAILHTPRPRKDLGTWSMKVLSPSHGVTAEGAWS